MRRYTDEGGRAWDVVVGRESWGGFVALFVARTGDDTVLQAPLSSGSRGEAAREVERLGEEELADLLERARPKEAEG